jgi:hypothetical protein
MVGTTLCVVVDWILGGGGQGLAGMVLLRDKLFWLRRAGGAKCVGMVDGGDATLTIIFWEQ